MVVKKIPQSPNLQEKDCVLSKEIRLFSDVEKEYYETMYKKTEGNIFLMTRLSKVSRATIYRKLIHYFSPDFREVLK